MLDARLYFPTSDAIIVFNTPFAFRDTEIISEC